MEGIKHKTGVIVKYGELKEKEWGERVVNGMEDILRMRKGNGRLILSSCNKVSMLPLGTISVKIINFPGIVTAPYKIAH